MSAKATVWAYKLYETFDMPPQERAVLNALCFKHNATDNACFPSYDTLAVLTGYRRRRVIQAVQQLQDWGLITIEKRRAGRNQASNNFRLFGKFKPPGNGRRQGADGGTLKSGETGAVRVQTGAPCQGAQKSTLRECRRGHPVRVQTGAPDREVYIYPSGVVPLRRPKTIQEEAVSGGRDAG